MENIKTEITKRFICAIDKLLETRKLKTVSEFEELTGIRAQRITGMRSFLLEGSNSKPYYANTEHIVALNRDFGVSLNFLLNNQGPIFEVPNENTQIHNRDIDQSSEFFLLKREFELLKEKVNLIDDKLKFYLSK